MKKSLLFGCSVLISILSFGQRHADVSVTMSAPANSTTIAGTGPFNLSLAITNNGPDTLIATDTLVVEFDLDNSSSPTQVTIQGTTGAEFAAPLGGKMAPGASASINESISFASVQSTGAHEFCAIVAPLNRSADSVTDTSISNNRACASITVTNSTAVPSVQNDKMTEVVFPNPMRKNATVELNAPASGTAVIYITDLIGRTVYEKSYENLSVGKNMLTLDVENIPAGNYILSTKMNDVYSHEKIVIQQ